MIEHRTKPAAPGHPSYGGPSATDPSLPEYLSRALGMRAHLSGAARRQCPDDAIARYPSDGAAKLTDGHGRRWSDGQSTGSTSDAADLGYRATLAQFAEGIFTRKHGSPRLTTVVSETIRLQ
ncbi:hypothetical protein MRX96_007547 [Rhipicephalus microplus]